MRLSSIAGASRAIKKVCGAQSESVTATRVNQPFSTRWHLLLRFAAVAIAALAVPVTLAATTTVSTLIDVDNNVVTGCSISTANGAFAGVDRVLNTIVVTDAAGYRISSITQQTCSGGTLGPASVVDPSSTPLARGNGANGSTAVETYLPNLFLPANGQKMRIGVTTLGASGPAGADALTTVGGGPILVDGPPLLIVPTLAKLSLALTALLLALSVWFARRRGWHGMQVIIVAVLAVSMSGQLIAEIVRDGFIGDWTGIAPVATDPTGDAPPGTDITAVYSTVDRFNVYFRIDTILNSPPVANAQSVVAVANVALPITLSGSDYEGSPLTFAVVSQPTHGTLTGAAPNLTYTANGTYGGPDSFTFRANDGVVDSADGTVTIDVKLPPTITSVNNATFIPGQANSFNFTASGAPSATFGLSACDVALPPSISVTNNGNNTATLAGNPTVAQGGTYVCTLTASNGFGSNATQVFTLNLGLPPTFTSANATTFTVGAPGSFTATTTATPATTGIVQTGALPSGVTFVYNGPGTPLNGTLAGTPAAGTGGTYPITLTAANGIPPNTVQNFTLTVNQTPAITSANNTTCVVAVACTFTVTASGFPVSAIARGGAALPTGMSYVDNGNGTGTLSGTPASGTVNTYALTFTPSNGVGAPTVQAFTLTVAKASQTISYTSTAPASASVGGTPYTVSATATSALAPAFSIDASATAICSITGATVSFVGVGTCVINANQAGNADFSAAPQVQQSFAVVKGNQTIAFTSTVPAAAKVAGPTYTVVATASPSGLPVAFSIDASAAAVCSISGATVSFLTVGNCVINANQSGNANYNAAAQVQQSFAVAKGDQTIAFTSAVPAAAKVGGATYTATAAASPSALPVSFSVDASAAAVCSISGLTVSFTAVGSCVINANQVGDTNYNAAPQVQQSFAVTKGDQTLSFTSTAPSAAKVSGATYTVTATATSGLIPAFSIDASATAVCSIAGAAVSFTAVGTCVIDVNQPGNANYNAAPQAQQSFAVGKGDQTIAFTSTAPAAPKVAGAPYTVTATATSGLVVGFTVDATASAVCSISGASVSFIGAGTCVINGNQAGNATYNAAAQVQQSFVVAKGDQTLSFNSTPTAPTVGGAGYTVTATATSGLAPTFSVDASAVSVCSIAGATVSFISVGTCVINANQAGNASYNAAPQLQQSFAVAKGSQSISFTSTAPATATVGGAAYTVVATATSGLPVTFTIDPAAASVCSIAGTTVSFIGVGSCVIDANQAGDTNYNAAGQTQQTFAVGKGNQTVSFTSTAPTAATVGGAAYTVTATATSALAVSFAIDPSAASVCSISGATVSFIGNGTCVINGNQAGNANYNAAPQAQQSVAVNKGGQTISFTSTAPTTAKVAGASYTVTATATSALSVTFAIDASATSVCSIAGATVTFIGAGTCVINANQAGNASFNPAPQAQQSFAVAKGDQSIGFTSTAPISAIVGGSAYTVSASATSGLAVTFSIDAAATSICSISGTTVSFIGAGACVINANQAGNANYNAASQTQQSFTVAKGNQTITITSTALTAATSGGVTYTVTATATSGLAVAFTTGAPAVCTVTGATVSFIGNGTCTINANQAGDANYNAAPQVQQSFSVKSNQTISFTSTAPTTAAVGGATYAVSATATSGLAVAFTIDPSASLICSISGATVSFGPNAGTCVINANQAGDGNYFAAPQAQQSFTVRKSQAITFTSTAPALAVYGGTYAVTATASSALTVALLIDPTASAVCSLSGGTVTFIGTGNCVINANQAGDATWYPAPQVQQSFTVGPNLVSDSYNVVGNTQLVVAGHSAPTTPFTTNATTILSNDTSDVAIALTTVTGVATTGGGVITINSLGALTYTPPAGLSAGTDTYVYTGTSNGVSRTATITFNLSNIVWYVDNASTGAHDGRSNSPFLSMGAGANNLGSALSNAGPAAGANIYVYKGTGSTAGAYAFKANQTLTGAASTLSVGGLVIAGNGANRPTLSGTLSANGVSGITVTGISMSTGAADAVNFTNASGNFTDGGLAITTTSGQGFKASGGGTVTVQGTGNTIASTTGTALNVANTTIGASGLTFQSISANGGANGIVLDTTGASGGLTISGTGTAASGGTIRNMVGADGTTSGIGIYLKNTKNVSLNRMQLNDFQNFAIRGFSVDGFVFDNSVVNGTNGTSAVENEGSISFGANSGEPGGPANGLTGVASISNSSISGAYEDNVRITNQSGSLNRLTMNNTTIGPNSVTTGNQGVLIEGAGPATINVTVTNSTFSGARGTLMYMALNGTNTADLVFTGNGLSNPAAYAANSGSNGLTLVSGANVVGGANTTFNIANNSFRDANGHGVVLVKSTDAGTFVGTFQNNTIGVAAVADSGSFAGSGIKVQSAGLGTVNVTILNNIIRQYNNHGIELLTGGGASAIGGAFNAKVYGNTVANPGTQGIPMNGIHLNGGTNVGDTFAICVDMGGAGALANSIVGSGANFGTDFRLRQRQATTVRLPGYAGANNDNTAVQNYGIARNTAGATALTSNTVPTGGGFVNTPGGATCF
ncbi:MAG: Ig-like domain-containing protein [Casimicrobium sp.]